MLEVLKGVGGDFLRGIQSVLLVDTLLLEGERGVFDGVLVGVF